MKIKYNNKIIEIKDLKNCNKFEKIKGLMFVRGRNARALLFQFSDNARIAIHSFFVFFSFIAIWLDDKNKVILIKKIRPFTPFILPKKAFCKLIEIPINDKYKNIRYLSSKIRKI